MKKAQILRAWKDPNYRRGLSPEELAQLPEHPAAWMMDVDDDALRSVAPPGAIDEAPVMPIVVLEPDGNLASRFERTQVVGILARFGKNVFAQYARRHGPCWVEHQVLNC